MANVLKPKRSSTASAVPTLSDLADGELAINSADKKFYMRVGGIIVDITPGAGSWVPTGGAFADAFTQSPLYYNGTGGANNVDVNTLAEGSKALVAPTGGNTNYPALAPLGSNIAFWHIETIRGYISGTKIQRAWAYNSSGKDATAYRNYNGTTWSSWTYGWDTNALRFQADFSNGTAANRAMFQSSTVNGLTQVAALPNGTSTTSLMRAFTHSDVNNSRWISIYADNTLGLLIEGQGNGTQAAASKDILFWLNGAERARVLATGVIEAQSYFDSYGAAAGIRLNDRGLTANNWSIFTPASLSLSFSFNGGAALFLVGSTGAVDIDGSAAGLFLNDRTTANRYGIYSAAGILRFWQGVDIATLDTSGNFSVDGDVNVESSIPVGYKNLVSAGANTWAIGKVNMLTAGSNIGTGVVNATYMAYNNTAGNLTLTVTAGVTCRKAGTTTTGALTLLPRGFVTLWYVGTSEVIASGHLA